MLITKSTQQHFTNEPVIARPPSAAYKFQKAWQRNKLVYSSGLMVAVTLLMGMAFSLWQAQKATIAGKKTLLHLYVADMGTAHQAIQEGNLGRARSLLLKYHPTNSVAEVPRFEWRYLWAKAQGDHKAILGKYAERAWLGRACRRCDCRGSGGVSGRGACPDHGGVPGLVSAPSYALKGCKN